MNKTKVKFIQSVTLEGLADLANQFLVGKRSLSAKYIGEVAGYLSMQLIYTEEM